ncbi:MAG: DNA-directed RNA polymerase subunit beta, partial [Planctomycetes bacterium]|nr:DNA-directed RNA polymerase subunit beta [Planctomycetota bacterium]
MEVRDFSKVVEPVPVPDLVEIQTHAYERFLQRDVSSDKRADIGLQSIIREIFPIKSYDGTITLDYVGYELGQPRYSPEECRRLRLTYGVPLKLRLRLNKAEPIEEEVYLGEVPLMIGGGEFIINGAERVIVSQLHRSPGIDFTEERAGDILLQSCWVVPERGSWIELSVTKKEACAVRIDQSGKIPATCFLRALSPDYSLNSSIIRLFYETKTIRLGGNVNPDVLKGKITVNDIIDPEAKDSKKAVLVEAGKEIPLGVAKHIITSKLVKDLEIIVRVDDPLLLNTLSEDVTKTHEDALQKIY